MKMTKLYAAVLASIALPAAHAGVFEQCPMNDTAAYPAGVAGVSPDDQPGKTVMVVDPATQLRKRIWVDPADPKHRKVCLHLTGGDGWMVLGDGTEVYGFGFAPAQGSEDDVMVAGEANANFPAPTIDVREGDEVWISLTNVGMVFRPDLFDAHSVHWHGYPQASAIYDGVPQGSITVNPGSTLTYYYRVNDPGTYMYHCHVEATEHMQMGMLGMLNVTPRQDGIAKVDASNGLSYAKFAYNDGDGSTGYDVAATVQVDGMDRNFHELHSAVQPLPFLEMQDTYAQVNGRGYPMTTFETDMPKAADSGGNDGTGLPSQRIDGVVHANAGDRILLRLTNLSVTSYYTVTALGLPMKVVGRGAIIARGPSGSAASSWAHGTASVTLGGGDGQDLLIDTAGIDPGTYYLYTTNLNYLSNGYDEDRGGLMTTIVLK